MPKHLNSLIEKIYTEFYRKFYNRPSFKMSLELNRASRQIDNFIALLLRHYQLESISINLLTSYIAWSFSRRFGQITKRDISLGWILGPKTFKKWLDKKEEEIYYTDIFINEIGINLDQLKQELHEEEIIQQNLDVSEELEKSRFKGEAQLFHCFQFTTLYNHRSSICISCENKTTCKRLLKEKFPRTFKKRGYENKI